MIKDVVTQKRRGDEGVFSRLSANTRRTLESLLRSPVGAKAVEEAEAELVARRQRLLAEAAELEAARGRELARLDKAAGVAQRNAEAAAHAAAAARHAKDVAVLEARGVDLAYVRQRRSILDELRSSADRRIGDFIFQLGDLEHRQLPFALTSWFEHDKDTRSGGVLQLARRSNTADCAAAATALQAARKAAEAMQLQALRYSEVSSALRSLCTDLQGPLGALELNPPSLTASLSEVGDSLPWNGAPAWVTSEPYVRDKDTADAWLATRRTAAERAGA